jgi:glycosidase
VSDAGQWFRSDPLWFKTAVFYEVYVRGFFDADDNGSGDIRGLIAKLDYLQWLGIDCVWLLPMYESPLRDGGYDIADYRKVLPEYGAVEDLKEFVSQAHERGIRVIADLVMNHTSSDHAWFREARSDPESRRHHWYVWSDSTERYGDARIIFTDSEKSNWQWDDQANAYYWHRFFHHQPDLNYDNSEVQQAMLDVMRYWLDLGLDGFRLDAVPYLYEREGTSCENLEPTHRYLRRVRAAVDANYQDRLLLAEANQWPADVVDYFGDGDECHMCFHFPVMPRIFMALRREEAVPIYEILEQTPQIPENCQWGLFLRNHDELTLEMVTSEEAESWDPATVGHVDGQRPPGDRITHGAALLAAGQPDPLLRGRDLDGRQRLPRGPRWSQDPHAMDRGPQRRLFSRRFCAALPAATDGSGVWLPGGQRGGPTAHTHLVAALDAPDDRFAQGAPVIRPRIVRTSRAHQQADLRTRACL